MFAFSQNDGGTSSVRRTDSFNFECSFNFGFPRPKTGTNINKRTLYPQHNPSSRQSGFPLPQA